MSSWRSLTLVLAVLGLVSACGGSSHPGAAPPSRTTPRAPVSRISKPYVAPPFRHRIPGMPPVIDGNVYSQDRAGMVRPDVAHDPAYSTCRTPRQHRDGHRPAVPRVVRVLQAGDLSQHVVPTYDLRRLVTLQRLQPAGGHRPPQRHAGPAPCRAPTTSTSRRTAGRRS